MPPDWKRHTLLGWSVLLSALVMLPVLAPGYVLNLDMVFVPHQTLLLWNLGIGAGLPRSVPQDAVVSLLAGPLPGQILQKVFLVAAMVLAAAGAGRLAGGARLRQVAAASLYVWSAYFAARLLMGHWGLLWAFALLPWVLLAARRARTGGAWLPLAWLCGAGALVPTGGLLLAAAGLPLGIGPGSRVSVRSRWLAGAVVALLNAPWWLPALRSPVTELSDPLGLEVFGARADGPGGLLLSVLGGGGVWNAQATLGSRATWFPALGALMVLGLAAVGWRIWRRERGPEALWLTVLAVLGVTWAWLSGVAGDQSWAQQVVSALPGGGLLRDGQKWSAYWVLAMALCAPRGLERLTRSADRSLRVFLGVALALFPLTLLPDLGWGGFGRLQPVSYPQPWHELRAELAASPAAGDVVSLPWAPFRRYDWNRDRVVLDPLPRYLTRTVVWNDRLPVTVRGQVVQVGGDDPRAAAIGREIQAGRPLGPGLADLGVRWVVRQLDQPEASRPPDLTGLRLRWERDSLQLFEVVTPVRPYQPRDPLIVLVDLAAAATLTGLGIIGWRSRGLGESGASG